MIPSHHGKRKQSRRVDRENRLVCKWIEEDRCVVFLQCRYHYERN
ncbi:MAG: type II toxin-antitoxin system YoeB family toxin [Opitutales bacterium]|nr:type II toxin-antitoxin system YoeB family toxin [Opitutales bacterium]